MEKKREEKEKCSTPFTPFFLHALCVLKNRSRTFPSLSINMVIAISHFSLTLQKKIISEMSHSPHISTDKSLLQLDTIHSVLKESYWAKNIPLEILKRSIENSICFGVYIEKEQIGFCRVITDKATFAYLADVFIVEEHKGKGYSKQLMKEVMAHHELQGLRKFLLGTADAHGLYKKYGFKELAVPERMMEISVKDIYR